MVKLAILEDELRAIARKLEKRVAISYDLATADGERGTGRHHELASQAECSAP